MSCSFHRRLVLLPLVAAVVVVAGAACNPRPRGLVPSGTSEPDKFLFDKGTAAIANKKWATAREYYKQIVETYTQSTYRPDAKLGVGDTYLGEGSAEALVLAINEYKEFLSFYPTNKRADYAQYKLSLAHFRQMRGPQRDQSETRETIRELEVFVARFPKSDLLPEVTAKLREARDRLSESDYLVGYFYFRQKWYPGAIDRLQGVLKADSDYTGRDAVFFYLAQSLVRVNRQAEALVYYQRIVDQFERSEYIIEARKQIDGLKAAAAAKTATASSVR